VKTPITEIDNTAERAGESARSRPPSSARATVSRRYGWLSRLRSYLIFDPLIWLITVGLGIISIPVSLLGEKGGILHGFARFWSELITHDGGWAGEDRHREASRLRCESRLGAGYSAAVRLFAIPVSHRFQEGIAELPDRGMALETFWTDLY
jgi:hypothetical protein